MNTLMQHPSTAATHSEPLGWEGLAAPATPVKEPPVKPRIIPEPSPRTPAPNAPPSPFRKPASIPPGQEPAPKG